MDYNELNKDELTKKINSLEDSFNLIKENSENFNYLMIYKYLTRLLNNIYENIYISDPETYEIIFANEALINSLKNNPIGKKCYEALQGFKEPCSFCSNKIILENKNEIYKWEYYNQILDKHYILADKIIKWIDGRDVRFEFAVNITDLKKTQNALKKRLKFEKVIKDISYKFINIDNFNDKMNYSFKKIGNLTNSSRIYIFDYDNKYDTLTNTQEWCAKGVFPQINKLQNLPATMFPWWMKKLHNKDYIIIKDVNKLPLEAKNEKKILLEQNIISLVAMPIFIGDELYGFIGLDYIDDNFTFSNEDINLLRIFSQIVGMSINKIIINKKLNYLIYHDTLTKVYNRNYFEKEIDELNKKNLSTGIIICDIDGLKLINDTFGHKVGDKLLIDFASILIKCVSNTDTIARIGGDEFVVLLSDTNRCYIQNIIELMKEEIDNYNSKKEIKLSASIGYAIKTDNDMDLRDIFKQADDYMYRRKLLNSNSIRSSLIQTLTKALDARDFITQGHAERLEELVIKLAKACKLPKNMYGDLILFAKFHDIGKVGISDKILFKNGPLNEDERKNIQRHSEIGYKIARTSPDLVLISDWILKHHEWWDGSGYPIGLKGEEIPLECRMLSIADAYDAMTNDRPYRKALSKKEAIKELKKYSGRQFDPELVDMYINII